MDDLRTRFRRLDRLQVPDLWDEAVVRAGETHGRTNSRRMSFVVLVAAILLLTALIGALALGTLPRPEAREPGPRLVAYTVQSGGPFTPQGRETLIWIDSVDGSNPRELSFQTSAWKSLVGWLPDGSGLLYEDDTGGLTQVRIEDGDEREWPVHQLCPTDCQSITGVRFALSPDGSRIAFVRLSRSQLDSVIAILDLATGEISELDETRTSNPSRDCAGDAADVACEGVNEGPTWSPDGTRLAFTRVADYMGDGGIFVVDADGSGFRELTTAGQRPRWSPDGRLIAFASTEQVIDPESTDEGSVDTYTIGSDGSNLTRLTEDGVSWVTSWTTDGRIAFVRIVPRASGGDETQTWVMGVDGANKERIAQRLDALTAAGCIVCIYPTIGEAYWQPAQPSS